MTEGAPRSRPEGEVRLLLVAWARPVRQQASVADPNEPEADEALRALQRAIDASKALRASATRGTDPPADEGEQPFAEPTDPSLDARDEAAG